MSGLIRATKYVIGLYLLYMAVASIMSTIGPVWTVFSLLYLLASVGVGYALASRDAEPNIFILFAGLSLLLAAVISVLTLDLIRNVFSFPLVLVVRAVVTVGVLYVVKKVVYDQTPVDLSPVLSRG